MVELAFKGLTKHYESVKALDGFTHRFESGKIHALIGKNGSGKSTFIKLMSGAISPTSGSISIDNETVQLSGPKDAFEKGVVTVYQELSLVPELTVAENIFLGRLPKKSWSGGMIIDWPKLKKDTTNLLAEIAASDIAPESIVSSLSVGKQQIVEIVKAMSFSPKILQLDEPTSALAQTEVSQLFNLIRRLRKLGVTIIYISHRLSELQQIADTVTAIRDGIFVGSVAIEDANPDVILDMMFGDLPPLEKPRRVIDTTDPILECKGLTLTPHFEDINLKLHKGEVLGIAGMLGSGRTELLHCLFGARKLDSGQISVKGKLIDTPTIPTMKNVGIGYTSEDRKSSGLVQILSSHANLCLAGMKRISPSNWISTAKEAPYVAKQVSDLHIKVGNLHEPVSSLSGGNQQKIVVGNWMINHPDILLFDEPSRGVDVQAKRQIYQIIWEKAEQGLSSIVVSTELEDLVECCDRILVLHEGEITDEFMNIGLDPKTLYAACMPNTDKTSLNTNSADMKKEATQ